MAIVLLSVVSVVGVLVLSPGSLFRYLSKKGSRILERGDAGVPVAFSVIGPVFAEPRIPEGEGGDPLVGGIPSTEGPWE